MSDRLQVGKPLQYFTKPSRPIQPPILSGTGNEPRAVTLSAAGEVRLIPLVDKRVGGMVKL